jgi:hypothetical protein
MLVYQRISTVDGYFMVIISDTGSSIMGISDGIFGYPIYIVGDIMGMHGNINILGNLYLDI